MARLHDWRRDFTIGGATSRLGVRLRVWWRARAVCRGFTVDRLSEV
jgi:hypothetical protein